MKKDSNVKARIFKNNLLYVVVCVMSALTAIPLLAILGEVLVKGWQQLGWSFLTEATPNAFKAMMAAQKGEPIPGGIANGIVGTLMMLFTAAIVAHPGGYPLRYLSVGVPQELVCQDGELHHRPVAGYTFHHHRYHRVYLGGGAHERLFGICG